MPVFYNFTDNSENLVSYSTYNASAWSNIFPAGATLTTGISAPDGSTDAVRFSCNNTTNALLRVTFPSFTPNGTDTYTTSFYVKLISGTTGGLSSDLGDGSPSGSYVSSLVSNQWVRVSFSGVPTATAKTFIDLLSDSTNNYTLDFWGVQIEKKSAAGAYVKTNGTIVPGGNGLVYSFDDIFVPADFFREGNLWTWGAGNFARLGNAVTTGNISTPVTTFAGGTNWKEVSAGTSTSAIKTDGTLWTWGYGNNGRLGNNDITNRSTPVTTFAGGTNWKQVSSGFSHTAAIKTDGTLWTWGTGVGGRLGNASTNNSLTPITTFAGGTNWRQVSSGYTYTAAIKTDGTLWTWGNSNGGKIGNGVITGSISTPVTTFAGGTNWKQVSSGNGHAAAIKTDGTLWTWGYGANGRLGNAVITGSISTPVTTFAGGTNWKQVSCGNAHTAAIKTDGTLWLWGNGGNGVLGNAVTVGNISTPVTTFAGGTNWKQVSAGNNYITTIKTDGTLWVWGTASNGRLGNAQTTNVSTPVTTFAGGTNWRQVSTGDNHTAALTYIDTIL